MERLADYIHRVTQLELEGKVSRVKPVANLAEQDKGRDCTGQCDSSGNRQDCVSHRCPIRQVERQDRHDDQGE